jgi:hypothetical protein
MLAAIGLALLIFGSAGLGWIVGFRAGVIDGLDIGHIEARDRYNRRLARLLADPEVYEQARVEALAGGRL